jgi:integrase
MATIRQRRAGVWEVRVFVGRDHRGKPIQTSRTVTGTRKDAQRVAAEIERMSRTVESSATIVATLLDLWIETESHLWAPATLANYRSRVELVKNDAISRIMVMRLSALDIDRWHARLRKHNVGEGSIRNQHQVVRASLAMAQRWGWVGVNAASVAKLGRRRVVAREALANEDVNTALTTVVEMVHEGVIEPAAAVAIRLAAVTGARRSELAALRWEDLRGNLLTIDSSIAILRAGRGSKSKPLLRDDPTKTGNRRVVTLDQQTFDLLAELSKLTGDLGPWILCPGESPINPERIGRWWVRVRTRAGIDSHWRLHDLRHWSATVAIAAGHDIRAVASRLGHANAAMTLRVYAHAVKATDVAVANTVGEILNSKS